MIIVFLTSSGHFWVILNVSPVGDAVVFVYAMAMIASNFSSGMSFAAESVCIVVDIRSDLQTPQLTHIMIFIFLPSRHRRPGVHIRTVR